MVTGSTVNCGDASAHNVVVALSCPTNDGVHVRRFNGELTGAHRLRIEVGELVLHMKVRFGTESLNQETHGDH